MAERASLPRSRSGASDAYCSNGAGSERTTNIFNPLATARAIRAASSLSRSPIAHLTLQSETELSAGRKGYGECDRRPKAHPGHVEPPPANEWTGSGGAAPQRASRIEDAEISSRGWTCTHHRHPPRPANPCGVRPTASEVRRMSFASHVPTVGQRPAHGGPQVVRPLLGDGVTAGQNAGC
jgi:hypothetical protein